MRKSVLYFAAGIVVVLLVLGGWGFVWSTERMLLSPVEEWKQQLKELRVAGRLPPEWEEIDIDGMDIANMQMKVPTSTEWRLDVTHLIRERWYVLVPIAVVFCFGTAWIVERMFPAKLQ